MTDQKKSSDDTPAPGMSEAERMSKIRELLVGPALADTSARVDDSFHRLDEMMRSQQEVISALQSRIQKIEEDHRSHANRLQIRLLGMVEALLADEDDVRARLTRHEILSPKLDIDDENGSA